MGDPFYLTYYRKEYDGLAARMTAEARAALAHLKQKIKDERRLLIGPTLCWFYSALRPGTLADLMRIVDDDARLRRALEAGNHYDAGSGPFTRA